MHPGKVPVTLEFGKEPAITLWIGTDIVFFPVMLPSNMGITIGTDGEPAITL